MKVIKEKSCHTITYGKQKIDFLLELACRKTLKISVHPDLSVMVKAPAGISMDSILEKVNKRASWIVKQQNFFRSLPPPVPERQYISGETHLYLGRQYRLKILEEEDERVRLKGGYIEISVKDRTDRDRIKKFLDEWYLSHAGKKFYERLEECYEKVKKYGIKHLPIMGIRKMKTRWGSCTKKRKITLNSDLIKAPTHCIDYVITHELCHLKYHSHKKRFYGLLSRIMPDWKERKKRLEQIVL